MSEVEVWKVIPGYGKYEASDLGQIRRSSSRLNHGKSKILRAILHENGYLFVNLYIDNRRAKHLSVHSLVMLAFVGPCPKGMEINHIGVDGNKTNNRLDNLEYVTKSQNIQHAYDNGLAYAASGESSHLAKLTDNNVRSIRGLLKQGIKQKKIGEMFGVSQNTISHIKVGRYWSHVE